MLACICPKKERNLTKCIWIPYCEKKREGANRRQFRGGDPDFEAGSDKVCNSSGECVICLAVNREGREGIKM